MEDDLANYFNRSPVLMSVADMPDDILAFHMLAKGIEWHVFFNRVNLQEVRNLKDVPGTHFPGSVLSAEAAKRYKCAPGSKAGLASRLQKASTVVLTAAAITVQDANVSEDLPIVRGTVVDPKIEKIDMTPQHAFGAMVQLYKPKRVKDGFVPEITDSMAQIYPTPTIGLPTVIIEEYKKAKTAEDVSYRCADLVRKSVNPKRYVQLVTIPPYISSTTVAKDEMLRKFSEVHVKANDELTRKCKEYGMPVSLAFKYAGTPAAMSAEVVRLVDAYDYLEKSRVVRGDNNGGLSFNTANYYYGDLPSSCMRAVNIAHNIMYVFRTMVSKKLVGVYMNNDVQVFVPAYDIIALNMRVTSVAAKVEMLSTNRPGVGWSAMEPGFTYMVPLYVERTMSKKKNIGWTWTPDYLTLMDQVNMLIKTYNAIATQYKVRFVYMVLTKVDPLIIANHPVTYSLHAHNGSVWFYPFKRTGKQTVQQTETRIAKRLFHANAWKNYYPFHRVPYVKFDVDSRFTMYLKRGQVVTPQVLKFREEFGIVEDDNESAPERVDELLNRLKALELQIEGVRDRNKDSVCDPMPIMYEIEADDPPDPEPVKVQGCGDLAQVFAFNAGGDDM